VHIKIYQTCGTNKKAKKSDEITNVAFLDLSLLQDLQNNLPIIRRPKFVFKRSPARLVMYSLGPMSLQSPRIGIAVSFSISTLIGFVHRQ
jgi:hypothetical protein